MSRGLLAGAVVLQLGGCLGPSEAERCAAEAAAVRDAAVAHFDATDPGFAHHADIINRPDRRREIGRLAYEKALTACLR